MTGTLNGSLSYTFNRTSDLHTFWKLLCALYDVVLRLESENVQNGDITLHHSIPSPQSREVRGANSGLRTTVSFELISFPTLQKIIIVYRLLANLMIVPPDCLCHIHYRAGRPHETTANRHAWAATGEPWGFGRTFLFSIKRNVGTIPKLFWSAPQTAGSSILNMLVFSDAPSIFRLLPSSRQPTASNNPTCGYSPGIPTQQGAMGHSTGSEQIPVVSHAFTRLIFVSRLQWFVQGLLAVDVSDLVDDSRGFCSPVFQRQPTNGLRINADKTHRDLLIDTRTENGGFNHEVLPENRSKQEESTRFILRAGLHTVDLTRL